MSTTRLKDLPPRLQDRYGYRRVPIVAVSIGVALATLTVVFGGWMAFRVANPDVRYQLVAWQAVDSTHTSITFGVHKGSMSTVECVLRVQNRSHHDVGYAIVTVPPGTEYSQSTYEVATRELGFAAEVLDCATAGNLHAPTPQFPPGTSNPPQPWRPA